jgi:capsule polysaccharide export protein KpsC/LpsZ
MAPRSRQISLDELVAGAMFSYPRYMSRLAGRMGHDDMALTDMGTIRHELSLLSAAMT